MGSVSVSSCRCMFVYCVHPVAVLNAVFAMVLFNVCSADTVECCVLYPWCVGVFDIFAVMSGRMLFSGFCNY